MAVAPSANEVMCISISALFLAFSHPVFSHAQEPRLVRLAVYQNKPLVFQDVDGEAQGLFVDLANAVAKKEGWEIEYVFETWDGCPQRLKNNQIDLVPSIAYTEDRDVYVEYSTELVWSQWGTVLVKADSSIENVGDFAGRKVAFGNRDYFGNPSRPSSS